MRFEDLKSRVQVKEAPINTFYVSLSDLMMLLCVFFAVIVGMSKIDVGQFERMKTSVTGNTKGTLVELTRDLETLTRGQPQVDVRLDQEGVRIDFESAAFFETGSAILNTDAIRSIEPVLRRVLQTTYTLDVEGHTDDVPLFHKDGEELETNWTLSGRRAGSVVNYLINFGFGESRLRIVGYAANRPRSDIRTKSGTGLERARAQNRRVSILVR
jgi:chemotaxis protein MotB